MIALLRRYIDGFLLALLGTVALASLLPCYGRGAALAGGIADAGIVLLFFLHGAKLSREAIVAGATNWPVHLAVLASTFLLFPALGFGIAHIPLVPPLIASGMFFLTLVPSTVQSSVAFTAIARGNVAAAACSASLSNLLGIFLTPLLVSLLMSRSSGAVSWHSIQTIMLQLLLPFILGHLSRRWTAAFLGRHNKIIGLVDRGAILLVVYTAFSAAIVQGLWHRLSATDLSIAALLCSLLLAFVLGATWLTGRIGFTKADAIVIQFCGSKKSLVAGLPMAGVLFAPAQVGVILLPLMLFHQIQLVACAILARHYAARSEGRMTTTAG